MVELQIMKQSERVKIISLYVDYYYYCQNQSKLTTQYIHAQIYYKESLFYIHHIIESKHIYRENPFLIYVVCSFHLAVESWLKKCINVFFVDFKSTNSVVAT